MAIAFNQEELFDLCSKVPYDVRSATNPDSIVYPCIVKFLLVQEHTDEEPGFIDIVYAVIIDAADLGDLYEEIENRKDRPGIEGYMYAESEETDQGTSGKSEGSFITDIEQTDETDIRPT